MAYTDPGFSAHDIEDGNITALVVEIPPDTNIDTSVIGNIIKSYSVTDSGGKTTTVTRNINIVTNGAPIITLNGTNPVTITEGTVYSDAGATAVDDHEGNVTGNIVKSGTVNTNVPGTYTITYTVSDSQGNQSISNRTVNVTGNNAPTIILAGANPQSISQGSVATYTEPGYSATDIEDGTITTLVSRSGFVNPSVVGVYTLTYTVVDSGGKATSVTRTVNVIGDFLNQATNWAKSTSNSWNPTVAQFNQAGIIDVLYIADIKTALREEVATLSTPISVAQLQEIVNTVNIYKDVAPLLNQLCSSCN